VNNDRREDPLVASAAAFEELGFAADFRRGRDRESGAVLTLRTRDGSHTYSVTVKRHVSRSLLGAITTAFAARPHDSLLVTDYITPPLADELRRRGIQFVDSAGNTFLSGTGLFVFVAGRKLRKRQRPVPTPRVFRTTGLKVTFALLSLPDLVNKPQRDIAASAGVALGSVPVILDGLRELGFVDDVRGQRRLLDPERLLRQWTEGYARSLEPTLELSRFSAADAKWWRRADISKHSAQWGGETAAALLHRHLVPEQAVLYAARVPSRLLVEHRLKADPAGNVVVRQRFWNFEMPWKRQDLVPPLLIYADLIAAGDGRSLAAAKQIHDEYLARPLERR